MLRSLGRLIITSDPPSDRAYVSSHDGAIGQWREEKTISPNYAQTLIRFAFDSKILRELQTERHTQCEWEWSCLNGGRCDGSVEGRDKKRKIATGLVSLKFTETQYFESERPNGSTCPAGPTCTPVFVIKMLRFVMPSIRLVQVDGHQCGCNEQA